MWKYVAFLGCIAFAVHVHSAPQAPAAEQPQPVTRKGLFKKKIAV